MISLLSVAKQCHHHIWLNADFKSDIAWWKTLASHWNGAALYINVNSEQVTMTSDASGSWGCGAWHRNKWFQLQWDANTSHLHISAKELIPIMIAAVVCVCVCVCVGGGGGGGGGERVERQESSGTL